MKHLLFFILLLFVQSSYAQDETIKYSKLIDQRDGKIYKTIKVGNQEWFQENLNFEIEGSWCVECEKYGRLYNFEKATQACPKGWHIPSLEEWKLLIENLGGEEIIKNRMRCKDGWLSSNIQNSDSTVFWGIPTPYVTTNGMVRQTGRYATWWSSTLALEPANWTYRITYDKAKIESYGFYKVSGFSVRCIKD